MTRFPVVAGLVVAALTLAQPVQAGVTPTCLVAITDFSPTPNATPQCLGSFSGNDANQQALVAAQIEAAWGSGFTNLGSSDDAGFGPFTSNPEVTNGVLTFDSPLNGDFALILKAGNGFSIYGFLGMNNLTQITFSTAGVWKGNSANSHAALWGRNVSVPEPGSALLLLTGLAGMAAVRRRRDA